MGQIAAVTLVVHDYDKAIAFFTECLGFTVSEDTPLEGGKRWVVVRPTDGGTALLLRGRPTCSKPRELAIKPAAECSCSSTRMIFGETTTPLNPREFNSSKSRATKRMVRSSYFSTCMAIGGIWCRPKVASALLKLALQTDFPRTTER